MTTRAPLAISVGDPGGVGPHVSIEGALDAISQGDSVALFGDEARLSSLVSARSSNARVRMLQSNALAGIRDGEMAIVHTSTWSTEASEKSEPTAEGGRAQLESLEAATASVLSGACRGLVTAPMSKKAVVLSGTPFLGHTEYLAIAAGLDPDGVTMMFFGPTLRVALVTTHLPIHKVPREITANRVTRTATHLGEALLRLVRNRPLLRIGVAGLNPHAGEGGVLGQEEEQIIRPALHASREKPPFSEGKVILEDACASEAVFRQAVGGFFDGVVAMYHDQATIASKLMDWGSAVNITWGLPFVRTSVDHGVAYDARLRGTIDSSGMIAAVRMAQELTKVTVCRK